MAAGERDPARVRMILGLGNPGPEYRDTRHNLGFLVVEELAQRHGVEVGGQECRTLLGRLGQAWLGMPQTFMNRSGYAAACLVERLGLEPRDLLVVLDDVQLPHGSLRLRGRGSPGGHRGLESILEALRTDEVPRLRLGAREGDAAPAAEELVAFVLAPFPPDRREVVEKMVERAADACESWLSEGLEITMSRFNG
jgi:peptidyl-tRNA hydrolase, PTH1 family